MNNRYTPTDQWQKFSITHPNLARFARQNYPYNYSNQHYYDNSGNQDDDGYNGYDGYNTHDGYNRQDAYNTYDGYNEQDGYETSHIQYQQYKR